MSHIEVIRADCRDFLNGPFCPLFDLIFADPPFNIGQLYQGYDDRKSNYSSFLTEWVWLCWHRLKPGAAFVLHGSVEVSRELLRVINGVKLDHHIECELCWAYNFGQHTYDNFVQTHTRAIVLRKPGPRKWYVENVLTPSKRLLMGDKRVLTSKHQGMVPFGTVWGLKTNDEQAVIEPAEGLPNWGRIQGNNSERRHGHPNQLPFRYVERFISAYSQPNDLVFDPFAGSGTTAIVCRAIGRHCMTTDVSEWNVESIKNNLAKSAL